MKNRQCFPASYSTNNSQSKLVFSTYSREYNYYNSPIAMPNAPQDLWLPMEVDTEFYQPRYKPGITEALNTTITIQCKSVFNEQGVIFAHPV